MPEQYVGTKFRTVFASRQPPSDPRIAELTRWCHRLAQLGVAGDTIGNLSFRTARGFIINRTAADLGTIAPGEFVEVLHAELPTRQLTVAGACEPSSESLMHAAIYAARPDVNAIFHGHSQRLLDLASTLQLPVTEREQPYGTPELAAEVLKILHHHKLLVLRNHGFVALGRNMAEAGRWVEHILGRL
jgi:ribulose-5-phosphate 4-epimerase/fuculose-1-phosphate aldolase